MLQGGLADQLKRYFAATLFADKLSANIVIDDYGLTDYHLGESTAFRIIVSGKSHGYAPKKKIHFRNTLRGKINKFQQKFDVNERFIRFILMVIDVILSIIDDVIPGTFEIQNPRRILRMLPLYRFRKSVVLLGYFPSLDYLSESWKLNFLTSGNVDYPELETAVVAEEILEKFQEAKRDKERNGWGMHDLQTCILHFRCGDNYTSYRNFGLLPETYYARALEIARASCPQLLPLGISDNVKRAQRLYGSLNIVWIQESDSWRADEVFSIMARSTHLIQSHSGLSTIAGAISKTKILNIAPLIEDGKHWRPQNCENLTSHWFFVPTKLWINNS